MLEQNRPSPSSPTLSPVPEAVESDYSDSDESEFGELNSSEITSASYISFTEPAFTSSVIIEHPYCFEPSIMAASQNFTAFNYPAFKKYGYYIGGSYYTMMKKGSTRQRVKCLYRRGIPRLETIKEEQEQEDKLKVDRKQVAGASNGNS